MRAQNLNGLADKPINEQASAFLERYLWEFQETFEDVLDVAEEFKRKAGNATTVPDAVFKELAGNDLRLARKVMGSPVTGGASFVEVCLAKYGKTVADFLSPPPASKSLSEADAARLKKAIEDYQAVQAEIAATQAKMRELEAAVAAGGVKGLKAKAELEAMRSADTTDQNRRQIRGAAAQRSAQKAASRTSQTMGADALKAKIAAAIAERMAKLQREEQERAAALAAQFAEQFTEPEQLPEVPASDEPSAEDMAAILAAAEAEQAAERARLEEEEARAREAALAEAEAARERERAEQDARLAREELERQERERQAREEAEELERKKQEAAAALEQARAQAAANEEARKKKAAQIAALEEEARAAAAAAAAQQLKMEEDLSDGPVKNFSAWNKEGLTPEKFAELERRAAEFTFSPNDWLNAFKLAKSHNRFDAVASLRRIVLAGTLRAIEQGRYELHTDEEPVPMDLDLNAIKESIAGARLYASDYAWPKCDVEVKGTAHFLQGDAIDVGVWLHTSRGCNPVVVVSVDPSGTGGAWPKGSCAQEEDAWRRTTLSSVAGATQYLPMGSSGVRYIPNVTLFRQGENAGYAFSTSPIHLSFIAATAPANPQLAGMLQKYGEGEMARLKQTARAMFGAALMHGHDSIVIPAFGCGFNKCHPSVIAPVFHDILVTEYPKVSTRAFKHVTFAIVNDENGPNNFEEFQKAYVARAKALAKIKADKAKKAKK